MPAIDKRSTIGIIAATMKPNIWSNDRRCQKISSSDRDVPGEAAGRAGGDGPKPVGRQTNAGWRANRQAHRVGAPVIGWNTWAVVIRREILDDANDFVPSTFALRVTVDKRAFALRAVPVSRYRMRRPRAFELPGSPTTS